MNDIDILNNIPEIFIDEKIEILKKREFVQLRNKQRIECDYYNYQLFPFRYFYQQSNFNRMFIYGETGVGKTKTGIRLAWGMKDIMQNKCYIFVPNKAIKNEWIREISNTLGKYLEKRKEIERKYELQSEYNFNPYFSIQYYSYVNKFFVSKNLIIEIEKILENYTEIIDIPKNIEKFKEKFNISNNEIYNGKFIKTRKQLIGYLNDIKIPNLKIDYQKQINNLKKKHSNSIIICDEIHKIRTTYKKNKLSYDNLEAFIQEIPNAKIIAMTGTPMVNTADELISVINVILPKNKQIQIDSFKEISKDDKKLEKFFKENLSNFFLYLPRNTEEINTTIKEISYSNIEPIIKKLSDGREISISPFITIMKSYQKKIYLESRENDTQTKYNQNFYLKTRYKLIFVYPPVPDKHKEFLDKDDKGDIKEEALFNYFFNKPIEGKVTGINNQYIISEDENIIYIENANSKEETYTIETLIKNKLEYLSPKFNEIIKIIEAKDNGKFKNGVIYSYFLWSCLYILAKVMEIHGYSQHFKGNDLSQNNKKRFCILETDDRVTQDAFNSVENKYGDKIRILLISRKLGTGINLFRARFFIACEYEWNKPTIYQAKSRVFRGEKTLEDYPPKEKNITVYYMASVTIDEFNSIEKLKKNINIMLQLIAEEKWLDIGRNINQIEKVNIGYGITNNKNSTLIDYNNIDETNYHKYFFDEEKYRLKYTIEKMFWNYDSISLEDIKNITGYSIKSIFISLENYLINQESIYNRLNNRCYLKQLNNILYLTKDNTIYHPIYFDKMEIITYEKDKIKESMEESIEKLTYDIKKYNGIYPTLFSSVFLEKAVLKEINVKANLIIYNFYKFVKHFLYTINNIKMHVLLSKNTKTEHSLAYVLLPINMEKGVKLRILENNKWRDSLKEEYNKYIHIINLKIFSKEIALRENRKKYPIFGAIDIQGKLRIINNNKDIIYKGIDCIENLIKKENLTELEAKMECFNKTSNPRAKTITESSKKKEGDLQEIEKLYKKQIRDYNIDYNDEDNEIDKIKKILSNICITYIDENGEEKETNIIIYR